jgi:hypothetical protein
MFLYNPQAKIQRGWYPPLGPQGTPQITFERSDPFHNSLTKKRK